MSVGSKYDYSNKIFYVIDDWASFTSFVNNIEGPLDRICNSLDSYCVYTYGLSGNPIKVNIDNIDVKLDKLYIKFVDMNFYLNIPDYIEWVAKSSQNLFKTILLAFDSFNL